MSDFDNLHEGKSLCIWNKPIYDESSVLYISEDELGEQPKLTQK